MKTNTIECKMPAPNRMIGKTLKVTDVGMGTMAFSHGYGKIPSREYAIEAIRNAYNYGCNFFDTADGYGLPLYYVGHNEEILGEALEPYRKNVVISTKFNLEKNEYGHDGITIYDAIRSHLDHSLKMLRTNYVDLYYLDRINEEIPVEEVAEVMKKLKEEGLIKEWDCLKLI